jgi:hypothetical protein
MTNNDAAHLILWHGAMHDQAEAQKHPREVWRFEYKQS